MAKSRKTRDLPGLTPRQARFVAEYVACGIGREAGIRAGYSKRTATEQAHRLLGKTKIQVAIAAGREKVAKQTNLTAVYTRDVLFAAIERVRDGKDEIALAKFLALAMKSLGQLTEKVEHTGEAGGPIEVFTLHLDTHDRDA